MTMEHAELIGDPNGTQAIIDVATRAVEPQPLDNEARLYSVVSPNGSITVIDVEKYRDAYRDRPRRKTGEFTVQDAESFVTYMGKHADASAEVWADTAAARVVGVINAHEVEEAGHSDHRVTFQAKFTDSWAAWIANDGKLLDQSAFAEFIEDHVKDIVSPDGAEVLELAQSFQASTSVAFESTKLLSSGERQFEYREDTSASGGSGRIAIPKELRLQLEPFEGSDAVYGITARFRYRLTGGKLTLGYHLERPKDVVRVAFNEVLTVIDQGIEAPIFKGITA